MMISSRRISVSCSSSVKPPSSGRFRTRMALKVERWDASKHGTLTKQNMANKLQKEGYSTTFYTFGPGTTFPDHSHGRHKKDAIIRGKFLFAMKGEEVVLTPGDMIEVPRGITHYAEVVGNEPVVFVDASKD